jgi:hypothetical protein
MRPLTSRDGSRPPAVEPGSALPPGHPAIGAGTAAEGPAVEGEIRLDTRVRDKARPDDVLYVIARNSSNRQVVAVRKEEGSVKRVAAGARDVTVVIDSIRP